MEQTEEYVNGQLKNKYGDAFIRGNNGMSPVCHNLLLIPFDVSFVVIYHRGSAGAMDLFVNSDSYYPHSSTVLYISTTKRTLGDQ